MDNKYDIDKIMYLLGQEDAMEELDKFTETHGFSKEYESEKMKMLKNKNSMDNRENKKPNGMLRKKFVVLIAAATATLAISLTALGVSKNLFITANRDEEAGTVTYDVKSDVELTEIPLINITPEYLPDGYLPLNGAPGKYALNGDPSTGEGILIYQNDYIYQPESYNISNVEGTTFGGVKAYINSSEGMDYKYKIDLIFEKEGQIISVGGSCSLDELKKVAENIKFEVVPGEFLELYDQDGVDNDIYIPPVSSSDEVYVGPDIPENHVLNSGEEVKSYALSEERPMITLNKVEIMDKLPEINPDYFSNYEEYLESINEDCTLKDYERGVYVKGVNNDMYYREEIAGRKFAYITLTLRNPFDIDLKNIPVYPIVEYRTKASNGTLEAFPGDRRNKNNIAIGKEPIYFDQSNKIGSDFLYDLKPKESKEIHLIYLLDDEYIDNAYIAIFEQKMSNETGYYFKLE